MKPIPPIVFLRAMGGDVAPSPLTPPPEVTDPVRAGITADLTEATLWRPDCDLAINRDGPSLRIRLFIPEHDQSRRTAGHGEADLARAIITSSLRDQGFIVRFTDALFCERGRKGWAVVAVANSRLP